MRLWVRIVVLAVVAGCASAPPPRAPDPPHPAETLEVARYLPDSTAVMIVAPRLGELLAAAQYTELRQAFAEPFERLAFELAARTSLSPLDPASLDEMGVALDGAAGVALLGLRQHEAILPVIFLSLAEPQRFKAALYRALAPRRRADVEVVEGAVLVRGDDFVIVLRGKSALVTFDEEMALTLARQPEATSLARQHGFRASLQTTSPANVVGYVDVRGLVYAEAGLDPRWAGADLAAARRDLEARHGAALARARDAGREAAELVRIDRDFRQARAALSEEATALRGLVGTLDGVGFTLSLAPHRIGLDAVALVGEGSPLKELFVAGPPCRERADLAFGGQLDLPRVQALLAQWQVPLGAFAELEIDRLARALSGRICLRLHLPPRGLGELEGFGDLAFALDLGVRDPAVVRAALERLGKLPGAPSVEPDGDGFRLVVGDRPIEVRFEDDRLVATRGPLAKAEPSDESGTEERFLGLSAAVGWPLVVLRDDAASFSLSRRMHDPEVPRSEAYAKKEAELEEAERALFEAFRASRRAARQQLAEQAQTLGRLSLVLGPHPRGLRLAARWEVAAPSWIDALAAFDPDAAPDPWDDPALVPLLERRARLARELDELFDQARPVPDL